MKNPYYFAYENRYAKAYENGIDYWGHLPDDEELTAILTEWVKENNLYGKRIIEFACGEGGAGVILSKLGCIYHGVDISPSVLEKARDTLSDFPTAKVTLMDMVSDTVNGTYDAALDVMGLHMLVTDPDRVAYIKNIYSCLTNDAPLLFFRVASLNNASEKYNDNFIESFDEWLSIVNIDLNTLHQITYYKDGKEAEIPLPYVPGRPKTKDGYIKELVENGFAVDSIVEAEMPQDPHSRKTPNSFIIYTHKISIQ